MTDPKKIDPKPLLWSLGGLLAFLGAFFSRLYESQMMLAVSGLGLLFILYPVFGMRNYSDEDTSKRKKNIRIGIIVAILATIIVWITIENRFNLETMAKTKSL